MNLLQLHEQVRRQVEQQVTDRADYLARPQLWWRVRWAVQLRVWDLVNNQVWKDLQP